MPNIAQTFIRNAELHPARTAIIHRGRRVSYATLLGAARYWAGVLGRRGIGAGDRVMVFVAMGPQLYALLLGIWQRGATAVFVDAWADKRRLAQAAELAECSAFAGIPRAHLLRLRADAVRRIPVSVLVGRRLRTAAPQAASPPSTGETALITFTTGSTGVPKAAQRTHAFLLAQHRVLNDHLGIDAEDVDMATLPIFVLNNLAVGATTLIPSINPAKPHEANPRKVVEEMVTRGVTTSAGSPALYERLAAFCIARNRSIPSLRKLFVGGAPVFPQGAANLVRAFPDTAVEVVYGSTEAEPISAIDAGVTAEATGENGLPVGKPIEQVAVRIVPAADHPLGPYTHTDFDTLCQKPGMAGEICVTGEHVLKEYFRSEEAQQRNKVMVDGTVWHRTGDAGYLDDQGHLFLLGRLGNRFAHQGVEYFPFPLEHRLARIPGASAGTYVKVGATVIAAVECTRSATAARDIEHRIRADTQLPAPDRVVVTTIPRDPRHHAKIDYGLLGAHVTRILQGKRN